jgi:hypothetical protein
MHLDSLFRNVHGRHKRRTEGRHLRMLWLGFLIYMTIMGPGLFSEGLAEWPKW